MIPVRVDQQKNTRSAADFTKRSRRGLHRMLTDWLCDVANEMEIEDGVIWVYGVGEDGVMAFTDFGIENLIELIKMHKDNPAQLKRYRPE
jgi:hypothetical protein